MSNDNQGNTPPQPEAGITPTPNLMAPPPPSPVDPVILKNIDLRLASIKESSRRSRAAFLVLTIACSSILFTLWNSVMSRDRGYAFDGKTRMGFMDIWRDPGFSKLTSCEILEKASELKFTEADRKEWLNKQQVPFKDKGQQELDKAWDDEVKKRKLEFSKGSENKDSIIEFGKRNLAGEWYKGRYIQVGLLGIHVTVGDFPVLATFSLLIIMLWFFYSSRRENRAIVSFLREMKKNQGYNFEIQKLVLEEIRNCLIFIRIDPDDHPLSGLSETISPSGVLSEVSNKNINFLLKGLSYLPIITIVSIILRDLYLLCLVPPLAPTGLQLGFLMWFEYRCKLERGLHFEAVTPFLYFLVFEGIAVLGLWFNLKLCKMCIAFEEGTRKSLVEFKASLEGE
jgi:hypothetical protein